ncbi:sodium:neurotransmitter symporter [Dehalogenimonas lykanthroporepellens BL-DC-9]|jgi:NSS family neurotransmitter:Na+ symporter|nr:sodium:neurotransmitter symporter [Dehalogenimonas lykanthroporepellens BL-DC-9]
MSTGDDPVADIVPPRSVWTSQKAYILASVAGVVGLGNLWRFPYMVGENGGGTFVAVYVICMLTMGLPLYVIEASAGKLAGRGPIGTFRKVNARWGPWFGRFLILITIAIMSYYLVISGWTLGYAVDAVRGDLKSFEEFTSGYASLWLLLIIAVPTFWILSKGLQGLEQMSRFLLPLLVLIIGGLAVYTQTLSGGSQAREFYFNFELDRFLDIRTWQMAAGQAFYSLAVGMGFLIAYGSYVPRKFNIINTSAAVALTNAGISIMAGLMMFPIVFTFGIAPDAGSQLSFTALPNLFPEISGGFFIGIAFYVLLALAAFTSCVGGIAVAMAPLQDEFHMTKRKAALVVVVLVTVLGIPSALSFTPLELSIGGKPFLDVVDQLTGSGVIVVAGIAGAAFITWLLPRKSLIESINSPDKKLGPMVFSADWIITLGRYLPVAAVLLVIIMWLL